MRKALVRRIERLEDRQATAQQLEEQRSGWSAAIHDAMVIGLALQLGANAREELDAANGSLDPKRRVELTKRLEGARSIASALAKYSPRRETPPSARAIIPGSLDSLLVELIAIPQSTVPPLCRPAGEHFRVAP